MASAPPGRPRRWLAFIAVAAVGVVVAFSVPQVAGTRLPVCTAAAASVITFLGLSLITNLAGHLSLCHAALAAVRRDNIANLATVLPWSLAVVGGALMVVPVAVLISAVAGRLSEVALAIATFGLANLMVSVVYGTAWMFGAAGKRVTPRPDGLSGDAAYFVLVALAAVGCCVAVSVVNRARPGRVFRALAVAPDTLGALGTSPVVARAALFGGWRACRLGGRVGRQGICLRVRSAILHAVAAVGRRAGLRWPWRRGRSGAGRCRRRDGAVSPRSDRWRALALAVRGCCCRCRRRRKARVRVA